VKNPSISIKTADFAGCIPKKLGHEQPECPVTFVLSPDSMLDPDHGIAAKRWDKVLT
jgi:hypothetical protein